MQTKFFSVPFAVDGNTAVVPDAAQTDGKVSFNQGYTPQYELDPNADSDAILVERREFNYILFAITASLAAIQTDFPQWVSQSDNDGTNFAYNKGAIVRFTDGNLYQNTVAGNVSQPGSDASWIIFLSNYATEVQLSAEISRAEAAEALLAPLASPTFTGSARAPTQPPNTTGTLLATCSFVAGAVAAETARAEAAEALLAPIASPAFTGNPTAPSPTTGSSLAIASWVESQDAVVASNAAAALAAEVARAEAAEALRAPLASPAFTGNPTAPYPAAGNSVATAQYVASSVAAETSRAVSAEALLAPLASPNFTGTPTAPTPGLYDASGAIANMAIVQALLRQWAPLSSGFINIGGLVINWIVGPYDPADNSEPNYPLPWEFPYPTACLAALISCDNAIVGNGTDCWYQTYGFDKIYCYVQRQISGGPGSTVQSPTRAIAIGIGY